MNIKLNLEQNSQDAITEYYLRIGDHFGCWLDFRKVAFFDAMTHAQEHVTRATETFTRRINAQIQAGIVSSLYYEGKYEY